MYNSSETKTFSDLSIVEQEFLLNWISENFLPTQDINFKHSDYGLKQKFSRLHFYVTAKQFSEAMVIAGFTFKEIHNGHKSFNISQKSPFFNL